MLYRKLLSHYYDLEYSEAAGKELDFYLANTRGKDSVLELGCGTGRILIPLLKAGINITGTDLSKDMLARCKEKCRELGLDAPLHQQAMQRLSLGESFDLIFIADGTICLITDDEEVKCVLANAYKHLRPGGVFLLDVLTPRNGENDMKTAGIWQGDWKAGNDGTMYAKRILVKYDETTRVRSGFLVIDKYCEGNLVESEENLGLTRYYESSAIAEWLRDVGFREVFVMEWASEEAADPESAFVTIRCLKPF